MSECVTVTMTVGMGIEERAFDRSDFEDFEEDERKSALLLRKGPRTTLGLTATIREQLHAMWEFASAIRPLDERGYWKAVSAPVSGPADALAVLVPYHGPDEMEEQNAFVLHALGALTGDYTVWPTALDVGIGPPLPDASATKGRPAHFYWEWVRLSLSGSAPPCGFRAFQATVAACLLHPEWIRTILSSGYLRIPLPSSYAADGDEGLVLHVWNGVAKLQRAEGLIEHLRDRTPFTLTVG